MVAEGIKFYDEFMGMLTISSVILYNLDMKIVLLPYLGF